MVCIGQNDIKLSPSVGKQLQCHSLSCLEKIMKVHGGGIFIYLYHIKKVIHLLGVKQNMNSHSMEEKHEIPLLSPAMRS